MGLDDMVDKAKDKADDLLKGRGGTEGLKEDAEEVKDIVTGEGSIKEKAGDVADALKDPGAPGESA